MSEPRMVPTARSVEETASSSRRGSPLLQGAAQGLLQHLQVHRLLQVEVVDVRRVKVGLDAGCPA